MSRSPGTPSGARTSWRRWRPEMAGKNEFPLPEEPARGHVILGGYGRNGRAAARALRAAEFPVLVGERNLAPFRCFAAAGLPVAPAHG